jgi:DNA-binding NtrC family response regulator
MPLKVFIIEDEELIRDSLASIIESRGYQVKSFSEPTFCSNLKLNNCRCQLNQGCADIIVTDINMPGMSGLDFLDLQHKKGCQVECIAVMSGGWKPEELALAEKMGYKVFHKPFDILDFMQWLDECETIIASRSKQNLFNKSSIKDIIVTR